MSSPILPSESSGKEDRAPERPARRDPPGRSEHLELELSILESENELKRQEQEPDETGSNAEERSE
jgi:hypothetical protein